MKYIKTKDGNIYEKDLIKCEDTRYQIFTNGVPLIAIRATIEDLFEEYIFRNQV